jgi:hypothetical protein
MPRMACSRRGWKPGRAESSGDAELIINTPWHVGLCFSGQRYLSPCRVLYKLWQLNNSASKSSRSQYTNGPGTEWGEGTIRRRRDGTMHMTMTMTTKATEMERFDEARDVKNKRKIANNVCAILMPSFRVRFPQWVEEHGWKHTSPSTISATSWSLLIPLVEVENQFISPLPLLYLQVSDAALGFQRHFFFS